MESSSMPLGHLWDGVCTCACVYVCVCVCVCVCACVCGEKIDQTHRKKCGGRGEEGGDLGKDEEGKMGGGGRRREGRRREGGGGGRGEEEGGGRREGEGGRRREGEGGGGRGGVQNRGEKPTIQQACWRVLLGPCTAVFSLSLQPPLTALE